MDDSNSSNISEQLQRKQKGNLSLCRTKNAQELCLGMGNAKAKANANANSSSIVTMKEKQKSLEAIAKAIVFEDKEHYNDTTEDFDDTTSSSNSNSNSNNTLDWFYEDGLLRAVDRDGYAHDTLCLGPRKGVTHLDGNTHQTYELVLQDCPSSVRGSRSNGSSSSTASSSSINGSSSDSTSSMYKENIFLHDISDFLHNILSNETRVDTKILLHMEQ